MDIDAHTPYAQGIPSPDDHYVQQQQQQSIQQSPVSSQSMSQSGTTHSPDAQQQLLQQQSATHSPTQQSALMQNHQQTTSQPQTSQPQGWPPAPHLLQTVTTSNGSPFPSPSPSSATLDHTAYPFFHSISDHRLERAAAAGQLSLNISSLSVTTPSNLSPITPSPHPSTASTTLSPITPLSPSTANTTPQQHAFTHRAHVAHPQQVPSSMFAYVPPGDATGAFDMPLHAQQVSHPHAQQRTAPSSRSSSSSGKSIPRKRSFTGAAHLPIAMEESVYESGLPSSLSTSLDLGAGAFDDVDGAYSGMDAQGSPIDGSISGGEHDEMFKVLGPQVTTGNTNDIAQSVGSMNSKPSGSNNFVSKLYQMIIDPKSAHFIQWTEHGSSFVVSNVGEFSRTILGTHFKHNNFSSFVRQLNMYGFHKINRTPRAQRSSSDVQTWEFSHPRFLRGRPDLLEEIKRKALEPDPSIKNRVELPGEVAAQLGQIRDYTRRLARAFETERAKNERLRGAFKSMHDFISRSFPGQVPSFPQDLWDAGENPPIYITSPATTQSASRYPASMGMPFHMQPFSPTSSPTTIDFPPPTQQQTQSAQSTHHHNLARTHSLQHIPYDAGYGHTISPVRYDQQPAVMELDESGVSSERKRQRTNVIVKSETGVGEGASKRLARARSDSAPLGYNMGTGLAQTQSWNGTHGHTLTGNRPRSGTNLASSRSAGRREDVLNLSASRSVSSVCTTQMTSPLANVSPKIGS